MFALKLLLLLLQLFYLSSARPGFENYSTRLLQRHGVKRVDFRLVSQQEGLYYTELDTAMRDILLQMRNLSQQTVLAQFDWIRARNVEAGRMQLPVLQSEPFPCDLSGGRSPKVPKDVRQLRPGDIDIVATCGDSSNSGTGILGLGELDAFVEYRGYAYTGGGFETWRTALTLPNILKLYNPRLYGYAVGHSLGADVNVARFNLAEPMLNIQDLPFQAHVLIERFRRDPRVNLREHWKLLSIQVGANDLCSELCHSPNPEHFLRVVARQLHETFRILKEHVPRLLINFIVHPDIDELLSLLSRAPPKCVQRMPYFCSCYNRYNDNTLYDAAKRFLRLQLSIAALPEFRSADFAIVPHGILRNISSLWSEQGVMVKHFFANDCIHYSQLGHAVLAKQLWNNMVGQADLTSVEEWRRPYKRFLCPSPKRPYLRTESDVL
ncbi:phospholipase B1, membrane-associated-like [Drosophila mojavensis]|uniref:phospholipase B1, membrane-associated-like n=1 Tax=Drosophila mojavensis TaxID=7230 RepID=UPI00017C8D3F|nr:phospholipase B1, membrane-associated-like [Drosophila mojavensis]